MVVAIVINTSWNIYNFRQCLIDDFLAEGHRVITIAPRDQYSDKLIDKGCEFIDLKMNNKGMNPIEDLALLLRLKKIYKSIKPDVILQYTIKPNIYGSIAAKRIGIPTICNVSGLGTTFLSGSLLNKIAKSLYRFAFKRTNWVFFQNPEDQQLFIDANLVSKDKCSRLPGSGINLQSFLPEYQEIEPVGKKTYLFVARLLHAKGIRELLDVATRITEERKDVVFKLCGAIETNAGLGITEESLKKFLKIGAIEYLGHVDDIGKEMLQCDYVVLPSYREGTPRALIEALALGKPIITTNAPGCKEVFDGSNGFICESQNSEALYNAVKQSLTVTPESYKLMSKSSRALAERKFDESFVVLEYNRIIKNITNGSINH